MDAPCIICGKKEWNYDVVDFSTGFKFCGGCHHTLRQHPTYGEIETVPDLLRVIADTIESYEKQKYTISAVTE